MSQTIGRLVGCELRSFGSSLVEFHSPGCEKLGRISVEKLKEKRVGANELKKGKCVSDKMDNVRLIVYHLIASLASLRLSAQSST